MRSRLRRPRVEVCSAVVCTAAVLMAGLILLLPLGAHRFEGKTSQQRVSAVQSRGAAFPRLLPSITAVLNPNSVNQSGDKSKPATGLAGLPLEAQSSISRVLGRDLPGYQARAHGDGFAAENARHKLAADFSTAGVELRSGKGHWKLSLQSYGYGNALQPVPTAVPRASANRVEYRRGALTEWYVNGPLGLEQGFTLNARPSPATVGVRLAVPSPAVENRQWTIGNSVLAPPIEGIAQIREGTTSRTPTGDSGKNVYGKPYPYGQSGKHGEVTGLPLTIALELSGNLRAVVDQGRTGLTLTNGDGQAALRYTGLTAHDSTGKELRAWLEVQAEQLVLKVEDARAHYPVVIDPITQLAELTASDGVAGDGFGIVAISGSTVVVGALFAGHQQGAAYVFVKPPSGWANMTQTAKLTASDGAFGDWFGVSVAISGDTVLIGASQRIAGYPTAPGEAYVFVKPARGWANMTQTAKLTASDQRSGDGFGQSVAIDGNTAVVGTVYAQPAYVFVEPATGWTDMTETAKLSPLGGNPYQSGFSVAISGNTVVAGRTGDEAAYVFVEPATGWTDMTQTAKLTSSDDGGSDHFGISVAVNENTIAVGAFAATIGSNPAQGAVYVFVKPATGWANMTQTAKLRASDGKSNDLLGNSVAISGSTVVAGEYYDRNPDPYFGAAYVFVEPMTGWVNMTQTAELVASDGAPGDGFGESVAISGDTVAVGGPSRMLRAVYVFGPTTVALSKTSLSFPLLRTVRTTSLPHTVKLTNVGSAQLDITGITLTGPDPGDFAQTNKCPPTVASGGSCLITVTFTPTAQGVRTASVSITDNAPGSPQTVPLTGRGTFFEWSPRSLNMGEQKVGTSSAVRTVTLTNAGTAPISLYSIQTAGDFSQTNTCGGSLNAGASCTIEVTFTPTAVGVRLGHVAIRDSAFGGTHWVGLLGKGT
jgi:FG-GAP repeat